jgi:hypothetical protein
MGTVNACPAAQVVGTPNLNVMRAGGVGTAGAGVGEWE